MKFSPKQWYLLREFFAVILIWFFSFRFFFAVKISAIIETQYTSGKDILLINLLNVSLSIVMGIFSAIIEIFITPLISRNKTYGYFIVTKALLYFTIIFTISLTMFFIFLPKIPTFIIKQFTDYYDFIGSAVFISLMYLTVLTILAVNFFRAVNQMIGPKIVRQKLFGKYFTPKEETRIFMFLDLQSSTTIAEKLGHLKYSNLIQDCFRDISDFVIDSKARVYQYVGDEVVLTWRVLKGENCRRSVDFYFNFSEYLNSRSNYYTNRYGVKPVFKASLNLGTVSVTEVGIVKKEIAYHGDVLNTAARIQAKCNEYGKSLLVSNDFQKKFKPENIYAVEYIDKMLLKGKNQEIEIFSITKNATNS